MVYAQVTHLMLHLSLAVPLRFFTSSRPMTEPDPSVGLWHTRGGGASFVGNRFTKLLSIWKSDVTSHVTRPRPTFAAMFVFCWPGIGWGGGVLCRECFWIFFFIRLGDLFDYLVF